MNFKPTKLKIIISVLIILIWYILLVYNSIDCRTVSMPCPPNCEGGFTLLPKCCGCISLNENLKDFVLVIFLGVLVYIIWSIIQSKKIKPSKEKK